MEEGGEPGWQLGHMAGQGEPGTTLMQTPRVSAHALGLGAQVGRTCRERGGGLEVSRHGEGPGRSP